MSYIYSESVFKDFDTENLLIVFDTNALLDLYLLPESALNHIISKFEEKGNLFWIPNQVYIEFSKHKEDKKNSQLNLCKNLRRIIAQDITHLQDKVAKVLHNEGKYKINEFDEFTQLLKINLDYVKNNINENLEEIDSKLNEENNYEDNTDVIYRFVENMKSDTNFTQLELIDIYEEGEKRYKYKVPPGYTDKDKSDVSKYGDLVIWKEMLRKVENSTYRLIFIQNERKEDWWCGNQKNKIPDVLKEEFNKDTQEGSEFYMMHFEEFIKHFSSILNIDGTSIKSINDISKFKSRAKYYVQNNLNSIVEYYVQDENQSDLIELIESSLVGESVIGGSLEIIDDIEIAEINVIDAKFDIDNDREFITYIIQSDIEVKVIGKGKEYINREYSEYCDFSAENKVNIELFLYIDISNSEILSEQEINRILQLTDLHFNTTEKLIIDGHISGKGEDDEYYINEHYNTINSLQMQSLLNNDDVVILDVRNPGEFRNGHIPDAINIPLNDIQGRLAEINSYRNKIVIVYSASGGRSSVALDFLTKSSFKEIYNLKGGIHSYNGRIE